MTASWWSIAASARLAKPAIALGLFSVVLWARISDVSETFWLFGEQARDWSIALGPWHELPLSGTPSTVGGRSLGPIYYWVLWLTRVTIGPFFDNLPHAGAIGLSIVQSAGDVLLFFALWRHTKSATLALASVLLVATVAYDMALSAMVWNPPLSVAFVKIGLALFIGSATHPSAWRMAATVIVSWFAVQAHSSAIFFFAPVAAWFVVRELAARQWKRAAQTARLIVEILLILQLPYLYDRLSTPTQGTPTMAMQAVSRIVADPGAGDARKAFTHISGSMTLFWAHPIKFEWMGTLLVGAAIGCLWAARREPWMLFVTVAPFLLSVIAFSGWTRPFDHYWYLTLSPPTAVMVAQALGGLPVWRLRESAAIVMLGMVLYMQSPRMYATQFFHRLPEYKIIVRGSREIVRRTHEIRDVITAFETHPDLAKTFPFVCLGGRVTPDATYNAIIAPDGSVTFRSTR